MSSEDRLAYQCAAPASLLPLEKEERLELASLLVSVFYRLIRGNFDIRYDPLLKLRTRPAVSANIHAPPHREHSLGPRPEFLQVPTVAQKKKLYFNVAQGQNEEQIVTVEGGGVNATIVTANIAATNGYIHIIDRVLGVPYTTVLDKLRSDPMLK